MSYINHIRSFTVAQEDMPLKFIYDSRLFQEWARRLDPSRPVDVTVTKAGIWGEPAEVHLLQITHATKDDPWPHVLMLVPPSVDVLTMATDGVNYFLFFVEQYRPAVGARIISNVAGGTEWGDPEAAARRELREELEFPSEVEYQLWPLMDGFRKVTPGLISEETAFFMAEFHLPNYSSLADFVSAMQSKQTGIAEEGERITIHPVPLAEVWQFVRQDSNNIDLKTEASLMYAGIQPPTRR
jgi:8-oxo-dGTP pyrophosphatase MutT (NUDIX family)